MGEGGANDAESASKMVEFYWKIVDADLMKHSNFNEKVKNKFA